MLSVIIGRFQTNELHDGHLELIRAAKEFSDTTVALIGVTAATGTDKNPLSYKVREAMVLHYADDSYPLHDMPSDKDWSNQVDKIIADLGHVEAIIWGGRDNGIEDYYSGKHEVRTISQVGRYSATSIRKEIAKEPINCPNFRAGIIHHVENRYPIVYSTVDVAIYKRRTIGKGWEELRVMDGILMGKKGDKFMFVGGFVDPEDQDLFQAAARETKEETGFIVNEDALQYEFSNKVDDLRYLETKDSIITHFFSVERDSSDLPKPDNI